MTAIRTIYVVNRSSLVTDTQVQTMARACDTQLRQHFCPAWGLAPVGCVASKAPPKGAWVIVVMDTLDEADALGWHTEDETGIHGVVGCKVVLDQGAQVLTGDYSVASVLSHEVLEMAADPRVNAWSDTGRGVLIATEVCDPVEADWYQLEGCSVSNFVLPAWFDGQATAGPYDQMGRVKRPFTMTKGGYWVQSKSGKASQKFGEDYPKWRKVAKRHPASRGGRMAGR